MRAVAFILILTLCSCKSMSGIKAMSQGGKTTVTVSMVEQLLSMFVMLQEKDSLKMRPIKIIKSNSKKTCQIEKYFVSLQHGKNNTNQ